MNNFDPKDLPANVKQAILASRESPLKFAENLLIDPTLGTRFKATYPQKFILGSTKRDTWICVHRRAGKCITGDTLVIDPITLIPTPISEASHFTKTLTFDFDTNKVIWADCTWIQSGSKKCIKIECESGIGISLSDDHLVFCSVRGWVKSSQLRIGDKILSPTNLEIFGNLAPESNDLELDVDFTFGYNKVSPAVYQYDKKSLTIFLREIFLAKGRILHQLNSVAFMFWNRNLSLDIRHLLLRLGINSRIDEDGNLFIEEVEDKSLFLNCIGIEHVVTEIRPLRRWETITNLKTLGLRPVYDLSVDHKDHNFIGSDIVLHNSYSLTITSLWHALFKDNQKIVVFAPSSIQINEFFDVLDKWIAKNPFLAAMQDAVGNHKNPQKRTFSNGSTIQGYLMGLSGSIEGAKKGITADVVICFPENQRVLTDVGWVPIGDVVNKGIGTKALSISPEGRLEWKKIIKRMSHTINNPEFTEIITPYGSLVCTNNHPILTARGYKEAQHLVVGDTIYYEKSILNNRRETNPDRHLARRWVLCKANQDLNQCQTYPSTWTSSEGLVALEIQQIDSAIPSSSERSNQSGIRENLLASSFTVPTRDNSNLEDVLLFRKEANYTGDTRFSRPNSVGCLVCRRWIDIQREYENQYTRILSKRELLDSSTSIEDAIGSCSSYRGREKGKEIILFGGQVSSSNQFNTQDSENPSRINAAQNYGSRTYSKSQQDLYNLSENFYSFPPSLVSTDDLSRLQEISQEVVYNLEIEDNHTYHVEGITNHNCDEAQLFDEEDWRVIAPIMRGDKFRMNKIRTYVAGTTPDNPTNYYYEKIYKMSATPKEEKVYIPVIDNPEYTEEMCEEIKNSTPLNIWTTEWLLELGETDSAVFRKSDIEKACQYDWEYGPQNIDENKVRFIGVDWDKVQAGTNVAVFQYDPISRITQVIYREEVAREKYTYINACNLIADLYEVYRPELVIADQGQGEVQWEILQLESQKRASGLAERLVKLAFNSKIEVPNPQTAELESKPIKPFLVGQLQQKFQEGLFRIPRHDETLSNQLLAYKVLRQTDKTTKYTTHNEHIIDCCLFTMYGIWWLYENILESNFGRDHSKMKIYNDQNEPIQQFQEDIFWSSLAGPRNVGPGVQLPRTSIDDPFTTKNDFRDFYLD